MTDFKEQLAKHIERLEGVLDLRDIAAAEGVKRGKGAKANWHVPGRSDSSPSLSIYQKNNVWRFKDFSTTDAGGSGDAVAFLMYLGRCNTVYDAVKYLSDMYGMPFVPDKEDAPPRQRSQEEWLADEAMKNPEPTVQYLVGRGIPEATVRAAIAAKTVGYSDWTSSKVDAGEIGYQGPAMVSIVRDMANGLPLAIDKRFIDPDLNGGVKTQTHGQKEGAPWVMDRRAFKAARRVYVVESAINALCIEACGFHKAAALAVRGVGNVPNIDWRLLIGKQVYLVFDADLPNDKGRTPGQEAAWAAYDALVALDIAVQLVDVGSWYDDDVNDVADIAKDFGIEELKERLEKIEEWAIPGLPGGPTPAGKHIGGPKRVWLPSHDFGVYWRYRTKADFTRYITEMKEGTGEDEDGNPIKVPEFADVAGFRVAALSRVTIASATSTMTGEADAMPKTVFSVSVQTARHGPRLLRRVLDDEKLHNIDQWKKLGPIYHQQRFSRLLNVLERTADCGAREAVNFVGLAWRNGKPVVNEGPDCYFTEPDKQCPYHSLVFPSGRVEDAGRVIQAYQQAYGSNAIAMTLVWALGGHLKAYLGFWPHMQMQAKKGSGKSTLIKRLERSIAFTMFSGQSLQTEFRLVTSISGTSHPVGWEEISARRQDIIDKAIGLLQENYQHTRTNRGSDMTEYLLSAPVLLAGEDVPVKELTGKLVRCRLVASRMGALPPQNLPRFPVREWLNFLAGMSRDRVQALHAECLGWLREACSGDLRDTGVKRMTENYAAIVVAWRLLCEFAGITTRTGNFMIDLRAEMNEHIMQTSGSRDVWVHILELIATELDAGEYRYPWKIDGVKKKDADFLDAPTACLLIRPRDMIAHISTSVRLRDHWNRLSIKSHGVLTESLRDAGVVVRDGLDKVIGGKRCTWMYALSLERLAEFGIHFSIGKDDYENLNTVGALVSAANDDAQGSAA